MQNSRSTKRQGRYSVGATCRSTAVIGAAMALRIWKMAHKLQEQPMGVSISPTWALGPRFFLASWFDTLEVLRYMGSGWVRVVMISFRCLKLYAVATSESTEALYVLDSGLA